MVNFEMLDDVLFDSLRSDSSRESGYVGINKTRAGTWGVKLGVRDKSFKRLSDARTYFKDFFLNHLPTRTPVGLTQDYLREILDYDSETGVFTWKVSNGSRAKVGQEAGTLNRKGYVYITVDNKKLLAHRLAWFYVYGIWPTNQIDHEDQTKHHNWLSNLRQATNGQNMQNTGKRSDNTSGHKGVTFNNRDNNWTAQITLQGKHIFLGNYATPELASAAYAAAQETHHTHRPKT